MPKKATSVIAILMSSSPMLVTQSQSGLRSRSRMTDDDESQSEAVSAVVAVKVPGGHTPLHTAYVPIPHRIPVELERAEVVDHLPADRGLITFTVRTSSDHDIAVDNRSLQGSAVFCHGGVVQHEVGDPDVDR
jgi:hypothetical protein